MKKLTTERRLYLNNKIRRHFRKVIWLSKKKKQRRIREEKNKLRGFHKKKTVNIKAPDKFYLGSEESRQNLIRLFYDMSQVLVRGDRVKISFELTKTLTPGGTLLFMAKIEDLLKAYPERIICSYPKDETVEQLFQHIGALSKLGLTPRKTVSANNVRHWHYLSGTSTDTSQFKGLFATFANEIKNDVQSGLYDSMTEAVDNIIEHAYGDSDNKNKFEKRWWMFSQQVDGKITVVICDLGIGIPESIWTKPELTDFFKNVYRVYKKRRDTGLIEIAVGSKKTRTKLPHRGKGLPDMLEFVRGGDIGNFLIYSYSGFFLYDAERKFESSRRDFKSTIPGTLIQWEIPLKEIKYE